MTLFGLSTCGGVAYALHYVSQRWDIAFFTWMILVVIPLGALLSGVVAGTGYWMGARLFHHRPTLLLLPNVFLASAGTYFAVHYFDYKEARVNGVPLAARVDFQTYMVRTIESTTLRSVKEIAWTRMNRSASPVGRPALGKFGWVVAGAQILGFAVGGLFAFSSLFRAPYCDRCSKYLGHLHTREAHWGDAESMTAAFRRLADIADAGHLQRAIEFHATLGDGRLLGRRAKLVMELSKCPECDLCCVHFLGEAKEGGRGQVYYYSHDPLTPA